MRKDSKSYQFPWQCSIVILMIDVEKEALAPIRALLVGKVESALMSDAESVREIANLADTAGLTVVGSIILHRHEIAPKFGMGSGKAAEISEYAKENEVDQIVFDFEISPTQQRNWEKLTDKTCIDRQELIIRIFAARSMTREASVQIELARLEYSLPRLSHTYEALSRQRGGSFGTKGSGETQLELDRRTIMSRIALLKKELIIIRRDRATRRKRRERTPTPSCAIVGYTNVGKSSLLNALTGAGVLSEDRLFATLDPTTRRFTLPSGRTILLTDTVGFIRNLPHGLVDAFRATLEEAVFADVVIILLDASERSIEMQYETTTTVLREIGANERPVILVLNKIDVLDEFTRARLQAEYPEALCISAKTGEGFSAFANAVEDSISGTVHEYHIPLNRGDLLAFAHREGSVVSVLYEDEWILLRSKTTGRLEAILQEFEVNEKKDQA